MQAPFGLLLIELVRLQLAAAPYRSDAINSISMGSLAAALYEHVAIVAISIVSLCPATSLEANRGRWWGKPRAAADANMPHGHE